MHKIKWFNTNNTLLGVQSMKLTIPQLRQEAIDFCKKEENIPQDNLYGITDGKAVGTYIEHKFKKHLKSKYDITLGSSGKGIDLPDPHINTDIKVTSIKKPQSSSPFKNIEQKIYGLGHNILIFVYEKNDINNTCYLDFKHCIFIEDKKSGDYNLTKILRELIEKSANENEIIEALKDKQIPGDNQDLEKLAKKIIKNPPIQGYLTISNAFQWRLKYNKIINLDDKIEGIYDYGENYKRNSENYQTPLFFTNKICEYLKNELKINPDAIIEPTCGIGNFLKSASEFFKNKQIFGIEIDEKKLDKINAKNPNVTLINEDIFTFNFDRLNHYDSYLIIGNPPWNTNTNMSQINSNIQNTTSFRGVSTSNALDLSELIILKIIYEFKNTPSTIAFLCNRIVSRNIFIELIRESIPYSFIKQINFNSFDIFGTEDCMCLFIIQFGGKKLSDKICEVSDISNPSQILYKFGFISDKFYYNIDNIPKIEGKCQLDWKSGIKHDCSKIIELTYENKQLANMKNEKVSIENTLIYPLLKSYDLRKPIINNTSKYIIITQQKTKENTSYIKTKAPKTWQYLNNNKKYFDKRKSSIYKNAPDFSIFGINEYSFKKYKVAISSFYKDPLFSLIYHEKTFMLNDSCYFLSFDNYDSAYITMLILNSALVKKFLKNKAITDSKRYYTKKILNQIDIEKCLKILIFDDLKETEEELGLNEYITNKKFIEYKKNFNKIQ